MQKFRSGFTLIELLVVIAIIAILASIMFPVFSKTREKARMSSCQNNMKQIVLSIKMYTQDHDDSYPIGYYQYPSNLSQRVYWTDALMPYMKNVQQFVCPSDKHNMGAPDSISFGNEKIGYCTNPSLMPPFVTGFDETKITKAAETLLAWDSTRMDFKSPINANDRHNEGAVYSYCDGHVKWISMLAMPSDAPQLFAIATGPTQR